MVIDEKARLTALSEYREFIGPEISHRAGAALTPRSAVPRVARPVNPNGSHP